MAIYNQYPEIATLQPDDIILVWETGTNSCKTITFADFLASGSITTTNASIPSLSALRAFDVTNLDNGTFAILGGYASLNDGGSGMFVYNSASSATDNGGTVIAPNLGTGRWFRLYRGAILPEWFGATANGITDDKTAIANAISAAGAGGTVSFTGGKTYLMSTAITISSNNVRLVGNGATLKSDTEAHFVRFLFYNLSGGLVDGFIFDGSWISAPANNNPVIDIGNSSDVHVINCFFKDTSSECVRLFGTSTRVRIQNCRFTNYFNAIFYDDSGGFQPTETIISGNYFYAANSSAAGSGAIKMSGTGSATSLAGHIIENNVMDSPGQMGVELQTWINGCSISNNVITGAGFGLSLSGVARTSVSGNTIKDCTSYGVEIASASQLTSLSNNIISNSGSSPSGIDISGASTEISITGGTISGGDTCIKVDEGNRIAISGVMMYRPVGGCLQLKNTSYVTAAGCVLDANGAFNFIFIDSTDHPVSNISITGNVFLGTVTNNGITLYSPANSISDVLVSSNNTFGMTCPGGGWSDNSTSSPSTRLLRIRSIDNVSGGSANFQNAFNVYYWPLSSSQAFFYGYYNFERAIASVNASGGARSFELPPATNMSGYYLTVEKSDSSGNAVTVTSNAGTINGSASVSLTAQFKRVTVQSDGANWRITQSN